MSGLICWTRHHHRHRWEELLARTECPTEQMRPTRSTTCEQRATDRAVKVDDSTSWLAGPCSLPGVHVNSQIHRRAEWQPRVMPTRATDASTTEACGGGGACSGVTRWAAAAKARAS